ncbi:hypothetical protein DENSPDRAFT_744356, partial [Dentipellis sp. KUC8613]
AARQKEHLAEARKALKRWHLDTWFNRYSTAPYGVKGVMPNTVLTAFASNGRWHSVEDIDSPAVNWVWLERHGGEVLKLMWDIDEKVRRWREHKHQAKMDAKKAETARWNAEKKRAKKDEQEWAREERKCQPPKLRALCACKARVE